MSQGGVFHRGKKLTYSEKVYHKCVVVQVQPHLKESWDYEEFRFNKKKHDLLEKKGSILIFLVFRVKIEAKFWRENR